MSTESNEVRCKVSASEKLRACVWLWDVRRGARVRAGDADGNVVHVSQRAFDIYAEAYPGLLTEQAKPGPKPKRKPKPKAKPATDKPAEG